MQEIIVVCTTTKLEISENLEEYSGFGNQLTCNQQDVKMNASLSIKFIFLA